MKSVSIELNQSDVESLVTNILNFALTIAIIVLLYLNLLCFQMWWEDLKDTPVMSIPQEPNEEEFAEAHKRNGVLWSFKNDGQWWFERNEKNCLLFSNQG